MIEISHPFRGRPTLGTPFGFSHSIALEEILMSFALHAGFTVSAPDTSVNH
jgi:hypothetical protein